MFIAQQQPQPEMVVVHIRDEECSEQLRRPARMKAVLAEIKPRYVGAGGGSRDENDGPMVIVHNEQNFHDEPSARHQGRHRNASSGPNKQAPPSVQLPSSSILRNRNVENLTLLKSQMRLPIMNALTGDEILISAEDGEAAGDNADVTVFVTRSTDDDRNVHIAEMGTANVKVSYWFLVNNCLR
jgi:hypothetical protein